MPPKVSNEHILHTHKGISKTVATCKADEIYIQTGAGGSCSEETLHV